MKIFAIMCIRNESYYLPTFLAHLKNYVDGIIALDDGSTDNTVEILKQNRLVKKIIELPVTNKIDWDEAKNRETLISEVYNFTDDKTETWVLCCDPDERFEIKFLKNIRKLCKSNEKKCYGLHFREIHIDKKHYRSDGLWNEKRKFILFPLKENMTFEKTYFQRHHIHWFYDEMFNYMEMTDYNIYHLKMLKKEDRLKRAALYNELDPDLKMQPIGYDYLFDEEGMKLTKIPFLKKYDYRYIPDDIQ